MIGERVGVVRPKLPEADGAKEKAPSTFQSKDASAALPQNCQTTRGILGSLHFCVNVTLVITPKKSGRNSLFPPGLASIAGQPHFAIRSCHAPVLRIGEVQADDVTAQGDVPA